jgi:restriction endonuclease
LVKRIEVASVVREDSYAQPYVRLEGIHTRKRTITARLTVHALLRSGTIAPRTVTVRPGDSLLEKTRRTEYAGYEIDEINPGGRFLRFANNLELAVGQELGADKEAVFEAQIRDTIAKHLRKQARLKPHGIKVLSLFFIDRVANYAPEEGLVRRLFYRAFDELKQGYVDWRERPAAAVQAAYFAQRRTRGGEVILEDSSTGEAEKDREVYDLIMKHYRVTIDTRKLVQDVVTELVWTPMRRPRVTVTKARVDVSQEGAFVAMQMSGARAMVDLAGRYPLPNLLDVMANMLQRTTPPVRLTRRTLLQIISQAPPAAQQAMIDNPTEFATVTVGIIKARLAEQLVDGIRYEKIDQWYEMTQFEAELESWQAYLVPSRRPNGEDGASLYDQVPVDSDVERRFVQGLERRDDVRLYVKLPDWFTVDTPIGEYRPDWAIVMDNPEGEDARPLLYLVRETKGATQAGGLRPDEARKVRCGKQHFEGALGVSYKLVSSARELG